MSKPKTRKRKVGILGDIHCPFDHKDYLEFCQDTFSDYGVDLTVDIGDEIDFHGISRFDIDPNGLSPKDEFIRGLEHLKRYYKAFPNMIVVESNHTARPFRAAFKAGIPALFMRSYKEFLQAPKGWNWHERFTIDGVMYEHGEGYTGKQAHLNAALANRQSTVIGHVHSFGGAQYSAVKDKSKLIFGLNVGCGINIDSYCFNYAKVYPNRPTLGCGIVLDGEEAFFVPMKE